MMRATRSSLSLVASRIHARTFTTSLVLTPGEARRTTAVKTPGAVTGRRHNHPPKHRAESGSARRKRLASRRNKAGPPNRPWVPMAYRGAEKNTRSSTEKRSSDRDVERLKQEHKQKELKQREFQERLDRLLVEVEEHSKAYRAFFSENTPSCDDSTTTDHPLSPKTNYMILRQIKGSFENIHESGAPVDGNKMLQSREAYLALCRSLQHVCSVSCSLSLYNPSYLDAGEEMIFELIRLSQDRLLLFQSAKLWANESVQKPTPISKPDDNVSGWLGSMVKSMMHTFSESKTKFIPNQDTLEYSDEEVGIDRSTQRLIRNVMRNIYRVDIDRMNNISHTGTEQDDDESQNISQAPDGKDRLPDTTSHRLLNLLDSVPPTWSLDNDVLVDVMRLLNRLGTVESARKCKLIYERQYNSNHSSMFTYVLNAYLSAIRHESSPATQLTLVDEVTDALVKYWDDSAQSHAQSESFSKRTVQCSIVLNCIASVAWGGTPGLCEKAEALAKRALGNAMYADLQSQLNSDSPAVSTQAMPLLNFLAHILAASGERNRILESRKILDVVVLQCHSDGLKVYPYAETVNVVLGALADLYEREPENKSIVSPDGKNSLDVIYFGENLIEFMHARKGHRGTWPSFETYLSVFRLIDSVNPDDAAERTQLLLNKLEARKIGLQEEQLKRAQRRNAHSRALKKWAQAAASRLDGNVQTRNIPCVQAFRLLQRMELQSIPMILSDKALAKMDASSLYDTDIRPTRFTYTMVLEVCASTANPDHQEKAADIAREVAGKMMRHKIDPGDKSILPLNACSRKLVNGSLVKVELDKCIELYKAKIDVQSGVFSLDHAVSNRAAKVDEAYSATGIVTP